MKSNLEIYRYLYALLCLLSVSCAKPAIDGAQVQMPSKALNIIDVKSVLTEEKSDKWIIKSIKLAGEEGALEHLSFLDSMHGWVASKSKIYKTSDGGQSWELVKIQIPAQAEVTDIIFVNTYLGWLIAEKQMPDSAYQENHFWAFQTRDGGQTWQVNYEGKGALARQLSFSDERNGWLTGIKYIGISPLRFNLLVLNTSDQGQHWVDVSDGLNRLAAEGRDSVNDWITGTVATDQYTTILTLRGKVFQTSSLGQPWQQVAQIIDEPPQMCICNLEIKRDGRLWIVGGAYSDEGIGSMILSENTKESWTRHRLSGVYVKDIMFIREGELLASGSIPIDKTEKDLSRREGVILYSADGGNTWSIIYHNAQINNINELLGLDDKHIMAIGDKGSIVHLQAV